jgi:Ser/Thr protein kinase RdoA (MazF antagonist)
VTTRPFAERLVLVTLYSKDNWFSARLTEDVPGENFAQEQKLADDTATLGRGLGAKPCSRITSALTPGP